MFSFVSSSYIRLTPQSNHIEWHNCKWKLNSLQCYFVSNTKTSTTMTLVSISPQVFTLHMVTGFIWGYISSFWEVEVVQWRLTVQFIALEKVVSTQYFAFTSQKSLHTTGEIMILVLFRSNRSIWDWIVLNKCLLVWVSSNLLE